MSPPLLISFYKSVYMYDFAQKMATFVKQQHERRGNILFISTEWHISSYIFHFCCWFVRGDNVNNDDSVCRTIMVNVNTSFEMHIHDENTYILLILRFVYINTFCAFLIKCFIFCAKVATKTEIAFFLEIYLGVTWI